MSERKHTCGGDCGYLEVGEARFPRCNMPEVLDGSVRTRSFGPRVNLTYAPMTNPTERPEERDSLAEIEERLANGHLYGTHQARCDLRTLINEVKRLRELEADVEEAKRLWDSGAVELVPDPRIAALEAEVKELREENDSLRTSDVLREALSARIKQMEEALREATEQRDTCVRDRAELREGIQRVLDEEWDDLDPDDGLHLRGARLFLRGLLSRAALSPSDTEERHEKREESDDDHICPRCGTVTDDPSDPTRRQVNS